MRWQRAAFVFGAMALLEGVMIAGCVEGVTPDCSDAATPCGPNVDGASDRTEASSTEVGSPIDGAVDSAADVDAEADAPLDAGDAG